MNFYKLQKYITGETLSKADVEEVQSWILESEANRSEYIELKNTWELSAIANKNEIVTKSRTLVYKVFMRYAAVFIIAFVIGGFCLHIFNRYSAYIQYTTIDVPIGERSQVILPDGTKVWLNAQTTLKYPSNFTTKNRNVIFSGEAFFEVTSDSENPFQITSEYGTILVLGTSFNLKTYNDMPFEATLLEGCIKFTNQNGIQKTLKPNQKLIINNNELEIKKITKIESEVWKSGNLYFDNEDLQTIARRLERQYGVTINIDESLCKERFSGQIHKTTLLDVMEIISRTKPMKYQFSNNNKTLNIKSI